MQYMGSTWKIIPEQHFMQIITDSIPLSLSYVWDNFETQYSQTYVVDSCKTLCLQFNCYKQIDVKCVHLYRIFFNTTFFFTDLSQKLYSELASDEPIQVSRESVLPDLLRCYDNDDVVLDLLNHVSEREAKVMSLAMSATEKESITDEQEDILFSVFARFAMRIAPLWGESLKDQLIKLLPDSFFFWDPCAFCNGW